MSNQDLPVGRRRNDQTDLVQPASVSSAPPWDSVLDRLANLERSHADLARMVASIHEALPPEIAAATGRGLALGSPIDAISPSTSFGIAPPIFGTPPPPLPERFEPPGSPNVDPFAQSYEAPDPWAGTGLTGESFFQPLESPGIPFPEPEGRTKRRLFGGRRAAKEAQARIAAEFAAPPPPAGFYSHSPALTGDFAPPPPPAGWSDDSWSPEIDLPTGWGDSAVPPPAPAGFVAGGVGMAPPPPLGFAIDDPNAGFAAPPGWFGSAAEDYPPPPPLPAGFASDLAEPAFAEAAEPAPVSWGTAADLFSPSDFVFDQPAVPPPPGFGPPGYEGLSAVPPPPPPGFGGDFAVDAPPPPPPPGFGPSADPSMAPAAHSYGSGNPMQTSSAEVFGHVQDVTSLVAPAPTAPKQEAEDESRFLAGTGTDRTSYTSVPPITPDFFARSAGKGRH
jgi:hypothetical protein